MTLLLFSDIISNLVLGAYEETEVAGIFTLRLADSLGANSIAAISFAGREKFS
jgi:hypothetical protein